ncbi:MAG: nucleotidyltransferase family protein [Candidatus Marinimicrobia bacterium]|nr:nucleotidyltransferase family protein [Candidatus Neomarinimicrobiota bacterium]
MSIDGVILAAGYSERMGLFKPALDIAGKPLLIRCIDSMAAISDRIIVVGGFNSEKIIELVNQTPKVVIVKNEYFQQGMFSSVRRGIREVQGDRFFIIPGDQPAVKTETYQKLLAEKGDIVIPRYNGKKGHPVLFNSQLIPEILIMPDTVTLRDFIHSKKATILDVDDPGIGLDVDTLADYEKIKLYFTEEMQ